ncbi:peroxide stress protein YaaA [Corynebacterium durum]|uniref:peroxide stress protein YaaA n=1 Tax=Corynebacterium durum TaxID=61592 RepID=UPI0026DC3938|nr:peroxide stress protein YaaA [Corynebacterium durum]MDO4651797.1 peroxide stress protein YaaA [Corynebacterium durum]
MLIVLPPSETKSFGGDHPPLDWDSLSFPELNSVRKQIAADLVALDDPFTVLGISNKLAAEVEANQQLLTSPTTPAILRYTGVLYDALSADTLPNEALQRLAIGSALFGVVRAGDLIPHYRLSGGTKLPTRSSSTTPTLKSRWGGLITEVLSSADGLVVDLRSGTYQQLGRLKTAITVRVESVQPDGSRKVVSHFNKHYKGELARVLALSKQDPTSIDEVAAIARAARMTVEITSSTALTLVV